MTDSGSRSTATVRLEAAGVLRSRCGEPLLARCDQCNELADADAWLTDGTCPICGNDSASRWICNACGGEFDACPVDTTDRRCLSIAQYPKTGQGPFQPWPLAIGKAPGRVVAIAAEKLLKHVLVAGSSGNHGKTHALAALATACIRSGVVVSALTADGSLEQLLKPYPRNWHCNPISEYLFPANKYFAYILRVADALEVKLSRESNLPRALLIVDYADVLFRKNWSLKDDELSEFLGRMTAAGIIVAFSDDTADGVSAPLQAICETHIYLPMMSFVPGEEKRIEKLARQIGLGKASEIARRLREMEPGTALLACKSNPFFREPIEFSLQLDLAGWEKTNCSACGRERQPMANYCDECGIRLNAY